MKCVCPDYKNTDGSKTIDFHVDVRLFEDDPIWEEMEKIDGVIYVYKPRDTKKLMAAMEALMKEIYKDDPNYEPFEEDKEDRGHYRSQMKVSEAFDIEVVKANVIKFFEGWQNGKVRVQEVN